MVQPVGYGNYKYEKSKYFRVTGELNRPGITLGQLAERVAAVVEEMLNVGDARLILMFGRLTYDMPAGTL